MLLKVIRRPYLCHQTSGVTVEIPDRGNSDLGAGDSGLWVGDRPG